MQTAFSTNSIPVSSNNRLSSPVSDRLHLRLKAPRQPLKIILDIFALWLARGKNWLSDRLSDDGLHPNVTGYQTLLEDILAWETMSKLLAIHQG